MPRGLIVFAHGSGSGRFSPRNNYVAAGLRREGFATLLPDLLQPGEEEIRSKVFDIPMLASRLLEVMQWAQRQPETKHLPVAFFGASTGAGAALVAAANADIDIAAVVSRGGRPDLAGDALTHVRCPTLLIVGSLDAPVIALNRQALLQLPVRKDLAIVPGASHLFEEAGTLDEVLRLAAAWFAEVFPDKTA
nr:dienelactone hydrolase family protein [Noviherbaspirillum saxi]